MKIQHISDTHGYHHQIEIEEGVNVICFTGDESNYLNWTLNAVEFEKFLKWFAALEAEHKLFIPGNHSTFVWHNERTAKHMLEQNGITWLHKTAKMIDGIKFYGDGTSPKYGDWVYMAKREKMDRHWQNIPEDTNILLTHTPPKGILDLSENKSHELSCAGCGALRKKIMKLPELAVHFFGHIHNYKNIMNTGTRSVENILFSNAASVKDGRFNDGICYNGTVIEM